MLAAVINIATRQKRESLGIRVCFINLIAKKKQLKRHGKKYFRVKTKFQLMNGKITLYWVH